MPRYFVVDRRTGEARSIDLKFSLDATEIAA
jgi:hypothetical protein